MKVITQMTST